jgi:hypothetical protein
MANSADAFKISVSDPQSGNVTPEVIAGGGSNAMCFQLPYKKDTVYPSMISYSRRKSLWGLFAGETSAGNVSFVYISGSNSTPQDTIEILKALKGVLNNETHKPTVSRILGSDTRK